MKTQDARFACGQGAGGFAPACGASGWRGPYTGEAARLFGVARGTVNGWMGLWEREGSPALKARRRGRLPCPRFPAKKKPIRAPKISRRAFAQGREDSGSTRGALWAQRARGGRRGRKNQWSYSCGMGWGASGWLALAGRSPRRVRERKK